MSSLTTLNSDYRWTPQTQVAFLTAFAETGSVKLACEAAGKSRRAAYNLRFRRDGAAFRMAWDAAVLVARAAIYDTLMDRVLDGYEEVSVRDPDANTTTRLRKDSRLGMALLTRLDRMATTGNGDTAPLTDHTIARVISQDFEAFLSLIGRGGEGAEAGLFIAARQDVAMGRFSLGRPSTEKQCELRSAFGSYFDRKDSEDALDDDADDDGYEDEDDDEEETYADSLHVTFCPLSDEWVTNFPPPPEFMGREEGEFGAENYERELSPEELEIQIARQEAERAPLLKLAMKARDDYFGFSQGCAPDPDADEPHSLH
jgi:hypothetical protein